MNLMTGIVTAFRNVAAAPQVVEMIVIAVVMMAASQRIVKEPQKTILSAIYILG